MRVIAGEHKGQQLKSTSGKITRPTSDKIKEAVFQQMGPFFQGGICLDLYAGSGALGIEAISRGMDAGIFVDKSAQAIQTIKENINRLHLDDQVEVLRSDAKRSLKILHNESKQFQLIFLDPPYDKADFQGIINTISELELLTGNGVIYCEHGVLHQLPDILQSLTIVKQKTYGSTTGITIYKNNE